MITLKTFSIRVAYALCLMLGLSSRGQTIVYDGFSYTGGSSLTGQSGGTGWLAAWSAAPGGIGSFTVGTGLSYPNLTNVGNAIQDADGSNHANTRQWFNYNNTFTNGTTIWFSFLAKYNVDSTSDILVLPFGQTNSNQNGYGATVDSKVAANDSVGGSVPRVFIRANSSTYGVGNSTSGYGLTGAAAMGTPILVVGRFVLSTNTNGDTLDVWVNQTCAPTNNSLLRLTNFTAFRTPGTSAGQLLIYSGYTSQSSVDELTLGYTYADVAKNLTTNPVVDIDLRAPADGSAYAIPANINLAAIAVTNGHALNKVQFYADNTTLLGEDTNLPFAFTWTNAPVGSHGVTARLVYDNGLAMDTSISNVYVFSTSLIMATVNVQSNRHAINPLIYGCNWANSNQLFGTQLHLEPARRRSGIALQLAGQRAQPLQGLVFHFATRRHRVHSRRGCRQHGGQYIQRRRGCHHLHSHDGLGD